MQTPNPASDGELKERQWIKSILDSASVKGQRVDDTTKLYMLQSLADFYQDRGFSQAWIGDQKMKPLADSVSDLIKHAELYGLFPGDYHFTELTALHRRLKDSLHSGDQESLAKADILLTDGFMRFIIHLREGRLLPDSLSIIADTGRSRNFFFENMATLLEAGTLTGAMEKLEPTHPGYLALRRSLPAFLRQMDRRIYTYVSYPAKDSISFIRKLQTRLYEGHYISFTDKLPDSVTLSKAIAKFQKDKKLYVDGKAGVNTISKLNTSDLELFKRIAITLDRYKQLPSPMPEKYIWVNLPGYYLKLIDHDTLVLESRVIVGKPQTRTPTLNSEISDMITYPQWTIPASIIKKDILPGLKKSPAYLARRNFSLVNNKGEVVDPYSINWAKFSNSIPYNVRQGSGDDNALGIFKFNFANPFSVYLHDTNQRYLFSNSSRALSHGCVRVQDWQKLAFYIARNDSLNSKPGELKYTVDSLKSWLAKKERKKILVKNHIPLFIRYFTCEARNGKVVFYDDIYSEDKLLRERYFASN